MSRKSKSVTKGLVNLLGIVLYFARYNSREAKSVNKSFVNKSAYAVNFELDPKWNWLLETNLMSDLAIVTQRESVDLLHTGSQEHLHNTESTPAGSPLFFTPPLFLCDAGHPINIQYC